MHILIITCIWVIPANIPPKGPQKLFKFSPFLGIIESLALTVYFLKVFKAFESSKNFCILYLLLF